MALRRIRQHLQGQSNKNIISLNKSLERSPQLSQSAKPSNFDQSFPRTNQSTGKSELFEGNSHSFQQFTSRKLIKNSMTLLSKKYPQDKETKEIQRQIKRVYESKKNIIRILKAWNLPKSGSMTSEALRETLAKRLGVEISQQSSEKLVGKYSRTGDNKLATEDFLKLIFNDHQLATFKPQYEEGASGGTALKNKIGNLMDDLSHYKQDRQLLRNSETGTEIISFFKNFNICTAKIRSFYPVQDDTTDMTIRQLTKTNKFKPAEIQAFKDVTNSMGLEKTLTNIYNMEDMSKSIYSNLLEKKTCFETVSKNTDVFESSSLDWRSKTNGWNCQFRITSKAKAAYASPSQLLGIDQRKTRFGATPVLRAKDPNYDDLKPEKVINEKQKISFLLNADRELQNQRYRNKLSKIREHRQNESQKIFRQTQNLQRVEQATLNKRRLESEAYHYVNYIKNKWQ